MSTTPTTNRAGTAPPSTGEHAAGAGNGTDTPVVLRHDPVVVRGLRRWVRAGRSEGRVRELHVVRGLISLLALGLLWVWAPGAIVFIAILTVLVFLHELGHYAVARRVGMRPTEFFVGFGPTIWARTSASGLRYGVKAIPAGGYVKIPGMGPREEVEASLEPYTYRAARRRDRLAVILAGVAVNFALAAVLFAGYAAAQSGTGAFEAAGQGVSQTASVATGTLEGLGNLVFGADDYARSVADGDLPENRMMSPIGGAQLAHGLLEADPARLLLLAAIFSSSLALLNLLPLLPLDGGHALLVVMETAWARIRRRPHLRLDPNRFTPVAVVVLVALLAVSASAMYLDVLYPLTDYVR